MQTVGETAQLLDGEPETGLRLGHGLAQGGVGMVGEVAFDTSQGHQGEDQPGLRPVVQIPLQALAFGVGRLHDPCAHVPGAGTQPDVLEGEAQRGGDGREEFRVVHEGGVVVQQREGLTVRRSDGGAAGAVRRHLAPRAVDVGPPLLAPQAEPQRRVAQDAGQRLAQAGRVGVGADLDDEAADLGALEVHAQQSGEERERHGDLREVGQQIDGLFTGVAGVAEPRHDVEEHVPHQEHDGHADADPCREQRLPAGGGRVPPALHDGDRGAAWR